MAANTAFVTLPVVHVSNCSCLRARGPYPVDTVKGVVSRVLGPKYVDKFQYDVIPADITTSHDVFEVPELAGKPSSPEGQHWSKYHLQVLLLSTLSTTAWLPSAREEMALETNSPFPILYLFPNLPLEWCPL